MDKDKNYEDSQGKSSDSMLYKCFEYLKDNKIDELNILFFENSYEIGRLMHDDMIHNVNHSIDIFKNICDKFYSEEYIDDPKGVIEDLMSGVEVISSSASLDTLKDKIDSKDLEKLNETIEDFDNVVKSDNFDDYIDVYNFVLRSLEKTGIIDIRNIDDREMFLIENFNYLIMALWAFSYNDESYKKDSDSNELLAEFELNRKLRVFSEYVVTYLKSDKTGIDLGNLIKSLIEILPIGIEVAYRYNQSYSNIFNDFNISLTNLENSLDTYIKGSTETNDQQGKETNLVPEFIKISND